MQKKQKNSSLFLLVLFLSFFSYAQLAFPEDSTLATFNQGDFQFDENTFKVNVPYVSVPTHNIFALDVELTRNPETLVWGLDGFRSVPSSSISDNIKNLPTIGSFNAFSGTLFIPIVCDSPTQETCFTEVYFDTLGFPGSNRYALRTAVIGEGLCDPSLGGSWDVTGSVVATVNISVVPESQSQTFNIDETTDLSINGNRVRLSTSNSDSTGTCSLENGKTLIEIDALDQINAIEDSIKQQSGGQEVTVRATFTEKITVISPTRMTQTGKTTIRFTTSNFTQTMELDSDLQYSR